MAQLRRLRRRPIFPDDPDDLPYVWPVRRGRRGWQTRRARQAG